MRRAFALLLTLVTFGGCASKSPPSAGPPQPSLAQRLFGGPSHVAADDSPSTRGHAEARDKDTDF
jgi:hypothetical protein